MSKTKVGVIGLGFVGGALKKSFEKRGQPVTAYDKHKNIGTIDDIFNTDIVFLCLPTPYVEDHGFDISILQEVCKSLANKDGSWNRYHGLVVIKSTIEPGITKFLSETYGLNIVHNPEFLTARTAFEDFDNQKHIVIGSYRLTNNVNSNGSTLLYQSADKLKSLYERLYPEAKISLCTSAESESMKLFCNNFYAMKVQIFNEFYLLCQRTGADFERVKEMMLSNLWISKEHTSVPGPDGKLSYSGACFVKDTNALNHFMKQKGTPNKVLEACISERNKMRKD